MTLSRNVVTSGGVVVSKIGEGGRKKKPEKVSLRESQAGRGTEREARGSRLRALGFWGSLTSVWAGVTLFQTMSGPTWLPPKQPEPSRVPPGRALPRGALGPPAAHGASKCSPLIHPGVVEESLATVLHLFFLACLLPAVPSPSQRPLLLATFPNSWSVPRVPGTRRRRAALRRAALTRYPSPVPPLISPFSTPASPQGQLLPPPT